MADDGFLSASAVKRYGQDRVVRANLNNLPSGRPSFDQP